ncbi:MAG: hypothetical protein FJ137_08410 [Deltaproteobacteria bacterium]|nr:hypothetical protein [Deltaproteobacteria bacterium]
MTRAIPCLALGVALAASSTARAAPATTFDPLVPPAGLGEVAVVVDAFASRLSFDDDGIASVDDKTRALSVGARGQWSIADSVAITASLPLTQVVRAGAAIADVAGAGDAHVGLRVARWSPPVFDDAGHVVEDAGGDAPAQFGFAVDAKLPLYAAAQASTAAQAAALGDGAVDVALVGEVAAALPFGGAFSWRTAYLLRGRVTDAVTGGGAFAVKPRPRRWRCHRGLLGAMTAAWSTLRPPGAVDGSRAAGPRTSRCRAGAALPPQRHPRRRRGLPRRRRGCASASAALPDLRCLICAA